MPGFCLGWCPHDLQGALHHRDGIGSYKSPWAVEWAWTYKYIFCSWSGFWLPCPLLPCVQSALPPVLLMGDVIEVSLLANIVM